MSIILIINILVSVVLVYFYLKFFIPNKGDTESAKYIYTSIFKVALAIPLVIVVSSLIFVIGGFLKDTFFLGPEPDLAGESILFEAEGEGVQLFWRHYTEGNEYTEEYLFDEPIEGNLSDVLLRDDGLWFVVQYRASSIDIRDIYI